MFDTKRSEMGELLYRLKYRSDKSVMDTIVETVLSFIASWNPGLSVIVPVPPSRQRAFQPVWEMAERLSIRLNLPLRGDCIVKIKDTPELKNVYNYEKRMELLEDAYTVPAASLIGESVLLFDDLYRSGATLNAIAGALYSNGEAANVYVLALTRTRSAS
ncbi:MAG: ComF family protein [Blastocatellia bacterium]|nr:ComF family protein [Blastocatellia bacterium]